MKTTVDAFGTLVEVGDTVVFKGTPKYLEKSEVIKCTPKGATVRCGIRKVNVRSERIYKVNTGGFVTERKIIDMTHGDYIRLSDEELAKAYDNGGPTLDNCKKHIIFPSQQPVMCQ